MEKSPPGFRAMSRYVCPFHPLLITLLAFALWPAYVTAADPLSFDKVASIFSRHCLRCHNDIDKEGDFSLQSAPLFEESGFVEPGDATASHLLSVITGADGEPPAMPKQGQPLSEEQVEVIRSWIQSGADWPAERRIEDTVSDFAWWSFQPITRPPVPRSETDWVRTPIDAFIAAKHREKGLSHAPEADRRTLIRRLTYDLTGLPPTPAEVAAFVTDPSDRAYEQLVERLLGSRHYGEHWARHWLDVVKYADTCGYDKDKLRNNAWPYRDYVIRSFNEDKPYGRFVQEQLAGDVLFPGQQDGILGLGFLAAGPWDFIGHVEVPESKIDGQVARNLDRDEMVSNSLNTFCSVTVQCARCHNHKFDPFTQEHYYSLQSVFAAVDRAERPYDLDPEVEEKRRQLEGTLSGLQSKQKSLDEEMAAAGGEALAGLDERIKTLAAKVGLEKDPAFGFHSGIVPSADTEKWVEIDLGREVDLASIVLHASHDEFNGIGAGFGFPRRFKVELRSESDPAAQILVDRTSEDVTNPGLVPLEIPAAGRSARRVRITATKLAHRKNDFIFALAEVQIIDPKGENLAAGAVVESLDSIEAPVRWSRKNLVDGKWPRAMDPGAAKELQQAKQQRASITKSIETPERLARRDKIRQDIAATQKQLDDLPTGKMVYAAATEFKPQGNFHPTGGKPRPIHLLHRGNVQQPLQQVGPGLLPLAEDDSWKLNVQSEGERRAALARWMTHADHPLVWRSIVNRIWQYHFGEGIVSTPNDFGRMGALPTHPELLDWLASEFRDGGQSMKQMHRLIVTSNVYRQSSAFDPANSAIDGDNRFLWRMNRRRLSAEEIRDSILAVSGILDRRMGGPGFYLFKLEKTEHSPHYEYHKFDPADPASHRRSIYRFVVRSQPDPLMTTLDCADSSQSTPKRNETLTSLQALSLLNNRFNLEMAKRFAQRLESETPEDVSRIQHAFQLVTGRSPNESEQLALADYADEHGLENMCRVLLNLSEFVYLD